METPMNQILSERSNGVATITLNRPDKLNAFAGTMRDELLDTLISIESDSSIRSVIITGAGRGFCSGGDVEYMSGLHQDRNTTDFRKLLEAGKAIVTRLRQMPQFVIAAVNGVAAGAGCNLALACDYRIASTNAKFGETFVRIGIHPDWGGTFFLPRLTSTSHALELMMTGRIIDAAEAFTLGLVDRVVAAESLGEESITLARAVADGPPIPIGGIKRAVYEAATNDLAAQIDLETEHQMEAFHSRDAREGMDAFFEKRKAVFRGE